ncbi:hypothetical protein JCM10207_000571 [Rhodosporidiobolus poonsookiae]
MPSTPASSEVFSGRDAYFRLASPLLSFSSLTPPLLLTHTLSYTIKLSAILVAFAAAYTVSGAALPDNHKDDRKDVDKSHKSDVDDKFKDYDHDDDKFKSYFHKWKGDDYNDHRDRYGYGDDDDEDYGRHRGYKRDGGALEPRGRRHDVITALTKYPQQSYLQLLNTIRDELEGKYQQLPQCSCSHELDLNLMGTMPCCSQCWTTWAQSLLTDYAWPLVLGLFVWLAALIRRAAGKQQGATVGGGQSVGTGKVKAQ